MPGRGGFTHVAMQRQAEFAAMVEKGCFIVGAGVNGHFIMISTGNQGDLRMLHRALR